MDRQRLKACERLAQQYSAGFISFDEYRHMWTVYAINPRTPFSEEELAVFVDSIPAELVPPMTQDLGVRLQELDFMPDACIYLVRISPEENEEKKRVLRPQYVRLLSLLTERFEGM